MRPRRSGLVALAIVVTTAVLASACSGGGKKPVVVPPTTPTVLPSADRIHLAQIRLGGPASCLDDAYCAAGLTRVYGIDLGDRVLALADTRAIVGALSAGAIDVGVLPRTSTPLGVTKLTDDRHLAPARNVVPVTTGPIAQALGPALNAISAQLDQSSLDAIEQGLTNGSTPAQVAAAWLQTHALPPAPGVPAGTLGITLGVAAGADSAALADIYAGALGGAVQQVQLEEVGDVIDSFGTGAVNLTIAHVGPLLEYLSGYIGAASADLGRSLTLLRARLADRGLAATTPSPESPGVAFVVSQAVGQALNLSTLSDLARASGAHLQPSATTTTTLPHAIPASTTMAPSIATPVGPSLGIGATGAAVLALQQRLIALGYDRLLQTGTFDEATRRAIVAFQIDRGLISTGVTDAPTQRAMAAAHPTSRPATPPAPGDPNSVRPPAGPGIGTVYLAFAGGPSGATQQIVQELNRRSATATFFGDDGAINRHRDIIRAVAGANGIGISAPPHDATSAVAEDVLMRTAARAREDLATATGKTSNCMLAPYGATDAATRGNAADLHLKTVLWDVDPQDWRHPGAAIIAADVIDNVRAGSIVLLHDGGGDRAETVVALPTILDTLEARGYTFAAIPDCVA